LNPRLGTSFLITENNLFRINYGVFRQTPDFQYLFDVAFIDPIRPGNIRRGNPELQFEKTNQYEFAYSRALTKDFSITSGVYIKQLENLVASRVNDLSQPEDARFANEDFGSVQGVELIVRKRMDNRLGFTASYTYQEAKGMVSDAFDLFSHVYFDPLSQYILDLGEGEFPLDFDQRHTANVSVEVKSPESWKEISPLMLPFSNVHLYSTIEYGSGLPFTKLKIDSTVTGGTVTETLVPAEEPNASRLPSTLEWNLKLNRVFRLGNRDYTFFADIRNVLARKNILYYDPYTDLPWNSDERLRTLAQEATKNAITLPAESEQYLPQSDLNGDRVLTPEEQELTYYRALVDRWTPVRSYDQPRQIRLGLDFRF
jgi:hypothetical protein